MVSIFEKFQEYIQKRDQNGLESLMTTLNEEELQSLIKQRINTANFTEIWDYILKSFKDTSRCHEKRLCLVLYVLKEIEDKDLPPSRINTVVNRLNLELTKFKSEHLAKLCSFCLECIQSKKSTKMGWKEMLPELLNVLVDREDFTYEELDYTGQEYKTDFINTLCMSSWSPNVVTTLAAAFIDMPLNKEEHLKVVNKLGTYIEKLTAQEIPAFIYQLLRLCKQQNGRSMFLRLQNYFGVRIYSTSKVDEDSSESTMDFNAIESTSNQDTIDAESTVLFHIHSAAALGYECIKDYLNSLRNMLRSPEFVLHPFQLMTLFTISSIPHYEETVFEIVRPCIVRSYNEEQKRVHSCWFREMVPFGPKPEDVLSKVIHFSIHDRDLVLSALVKFGFALLGVGSALGRDMIAEKQWNLGNMILLKIIKRKRLIALSILQTLSNHIVTRQTVSQYIECLYILGKTSPLLMLENQSCIVELVDCLVQVSGPVANQLLDALIPLTKVSPTIRDHLIILLRKALYSRSIETRQMAVNGFLKLITHLKISNLASLSQSNQSSGSFTGHSFFTQISLNKSSQNVGSSGFSNEALCLEVLSILKRCFMQQMEVRMQLYEGLYDAVCMNPELGIPVLDVIWFHFSEYYVMDEEQLPPLIFDKIVSVREVQAMLQEPLGKLVYAIGLIVTKVLESEEDRENNTVVKFVNILESLCRRLPNCELVHIELDDGTDLLDIMPESQKKMLILKEAMSVYEALIGYKLFSWTENSENHGKQIQNLYQGYSRLFNFSKALSKPKKGGGKKRKTDNKSQPTQADTTMKKDSQKPKVFKVPDSILGFQTLVKGLSLLHESNVTWASSSEANLLKPKKELHQHLMQATLHLVQNAKRRKDIETKVKKFYFDHISAIAAILFNRIIKRMNEFIDFDSISAVLAMECFNMILILVNTQYRSNMKQFLSKIVPQENDDGTIISQLLELVRVYQKLFEMDEDESGDDPESKKMSLIVINTLTTLSGFFPGMVNSSTIQMAEWLKNFAYNNNVTSKVSSAFSNLFFETHVKCRVSLNLLEVISVSIGETMGVLTEEDLTPETFKIINEATVHSMLLSLCSTVKSVLEDIEALIARLKSEYHLLMYPGVENLERKKENLKAKERGICCQLCFIINIMTNIVNLLVPAGNMTEAIFKNIMLLYSTLSALTKHFIMRSSKINLAFQGARFERVVKLTGKQLAPAIYKFIIHMEESEKDATQASPQKKKSVDANTLKSKVLRETRLIPKVIYEIEQFSKCVIQLSNKTKVDLNKYVGQGTVRDFRIMELDKVLEKAGGDVDTTTQSTQANRSTASEEGSNEEVEEEEDEDRPPPTKRSRI
ncbi:LOW QUALITY PROTEIN: Fanconi anemia complementation group I [Leptinotarsa decemlineata]|uniref:LOW QUALITY PROTEIN: Fanconi anemia complementation group I n=1 Tax=Leptinotarsa decemlineata TaxID=7539 RepID=UPI003D309F90